MLWILSPIFLSIQNTGSFKWLWFEYTIACLLFDGYYVKMGLIVDINNNHSLDLKIKAMNGIRPGILLAYDSSKISKVIT